MTAIHTGELVKLLLFFTKFTLKRVNTDCKPLQRHCNALGLVWFLFLKCHVIFKHLFSLVSHLKILVPELSTDLSGDSHVAKY